MRVCNDTWVVTLLVCPHGRQCIAPCKWAALVDALSTQLCRTCVRMSCYAVQEHSNGESDLTPGLRAMALRWVEGVALQAFVDTREQTRRPTPGPALAQWFATGSVAVYLAVRAVTRADAVLAFVHNTLEFMSKMMARIAAIFASVAASKQHATKAAATVTATGSKGANSQRSSGRAGLSGRSASGPSPAASAGSGVSRLAGAAAAGAAGVAQAASASASQTMQQTGPLGHPAGSTLQRGGDADSDVHASPAEALAAGRQVSSSELDAFAAANTAARAANRRLSSYDDEDGEMGALAGAQEGRGARGMMMRGGEEHEEGAKGPATARARRMAAAVDYDEQLDGEEEVEPIIGA